MRQGAYNCLACGGALSGHEPLHCTQCQQEYTVAAGIPVLVDDASKYASAIYKLYYKFILDKQEETAQLQQQSLHQQHRLEAIQHFTTALDHNNTLVRTLVGPINDLVRKEDLIAAERANFIYSPLKDFTYLKRDWSGLEEDEYQVAHLMETLRVPLEACKIPKEKVLVLGAGLGRVAAELCTDFEAVYATDLSYSMLHCFRQMLSGEAIQFYEINYGNTKSTHASARKIEARLRGALANRPELSERLHYFVSDVLKSPFEAESFPCICAVYFTDVLPLRQLLPEISRLLQPSGYFVHLGPLGYGNTTQADRYSCQEVKEYLQNNGFEVIYDAFESAMHLDSSIVMAHNYFDNWVMVAQKKALPGPESLSTGCMLHIVKGVRFQITGDLGTGGDKNIKIFKPDGNALDLQPVALDILEYISTGLTLEALLSIMEEQYDMEDPGPLLDLILQLVHMGVVRITEGGTLPD